MPMLDIFRIAVQLALVSIPFASTPAIPDQPPPPGRLVDLGGRKLHLYCTGQGRPTVILETGAGSFSIDWALVQPEVAQRTRVCSYDRAGYGWSDPGPEWDSVTQVANDLETGLSKAGEHPPYVLVGQSMGGLFVRWYQHEHPDQVVGMVLVETYETTAPVNGKQVPLYTLTQEQLQANLPPPSSLKKPLLPAEVHPPFDKLPPNLQKNHLWLERHFFETLDFNKGPEMMESWRSAFSVLHQASLKQDSLDALPLVILTREDVNDDERQQQKDLSHLSSRSRWEIAVRSGHFVQLERPDLVIAAVNEVMRPVERPPKAVSLEQPMKRPCLLMTLLAAFCAARAQEQPKPEPAMDAIIKAFDSHSVVMLGELHGNRQEYELLRGLVFSRHFADRVNDLVLEYGNALYQDVVDRYVAGESIPVEEVQKAWRNTTAIGPPSPIYGWLYEAVREANRKRHQKLRIVLGDVYVNWDRVKNREDLGPFVANRDPFYASVVREQVMARHHRALLVAGYPHFLRSTAGPNIIEKELRVAGATTFVIVPGTNTIDGYDDLDKRFDSWSRPPCIVALKGNWVGQLAAQAVLSGGTIPSPPGENLKLEEAGDAFLYLGPRDSLTQIHTTRAELQGTAYGKEIERRLEIMFGRPVDFVSAQKETPEFSRNTGPPPPLPPPPKSIHDPLPPKPPVK